MTAIGPEFPNVLAAACEGADWAWSALYHSVAPQIAGYARAKGAPEPDDVVGEVFHDVARNIHRFSGSEANFRSWVFGVAHNRLVDQWRAQERRQRHPRRVMDTAESAEMAVVSSSLDGPAFAALESLTDSQRTVILMRTIGELSLAEVADALGTNTNAVKALQHRAVRQLRKNLADGRNPPATLVGND